MMVKVFFGSLRRPVLKNIYTYMHAYIHKREDWVDYKKAFDTVPHEIGSKTSGVGRNNREHTLVDHIVPQRKKAKTDCPGRDARKEKCNK